MRLSLYTVLIISASTQGKNVRKSGFQTDNFDSLDTFETFDTFINLPELATTTTNTIPNTLNPPLTSVISNINAQTLPTKSSQIVINPISTTISSNSPVLSTSSTRTPLDSTAKVTSIPLQIAVNPPESPKSNTTTANSSTAAPNNSSSKILTILGIIGCVVVLAIVGIYIFRKTSLKKSTDFENRLNLDYAPSLERSEKFKSQNFIESDMDQNRGAL